MNSDIYIANIKKLKLNYIIQLIVNIVIIAFNFILIIEIFWLKSIFYYIYLSISIFGIFYFLIPIFLFLIILFKNLTQKSIKIYKTISIIFCVLVIITGLGLISILMMNTLETTEYCRECPFNLKNSYINNIYEDYVNNNIEEKKLKELCTNRRCIYNNENVDVLYPYEYICNYDPTKEFDKIKNDSYLNETINQIDCILIEKSNNKNHFKNDEIHKFKDMCNSYEEFYICQRISEPLTYSFKEDFKCPKNNYFTILLIFCLVNAILNLIISFLPWRAEYIKYDKLIRILTQGNHRNHRNRSKSFNSTQNNTKIYNGNKEESFKKEPTEIIIVYNETEENINTDQNISFDNNVENKKEEEVINNIIQLKKDINDENTKNFETNNNKKININKKQKKEENFSIKLYKKNDSPIIRKKNNKRIKEIKKSYFRSNSHKIAYNSERNILEETKSVPGIHNHN